MSILSVNKCGLRDNDPVGESAAARNGESGGVFLAETCAFAIVGVWIRKSFVRLHDIEKTSSSGELQTVFIFRVMRRGVLLFGVLA